MTESNKEDDAVDQLNQRFLQAADDALRFWRGAVPISVSQSVSIKFRVCFPLIAHSLNHVASALASATRMPFAAESSARIAFEHSLAAQWVLLTHGGESQFVRHMEYGYLVRVKAFSQAIGGPHELSDIVALKAVDGRERSWSVEQACARFDTSGLLYDIYRDLSQAVHPSYGTLRAYLGIESLDGDAVQISSTGGLGPVTELPRALGVSAVWAIDVLERLREDQPNLAKVEQIAQAGKIPIDLAREDKQPDLQLPPNAS